jgi:formylglycine-generating enzyme required for sulfatase activity
MLNPAPISAISLPCAVLRAFILQSFGCRSTVEHLGLEDAGPGVDAGGSDGSQAPRSSAAGSAVLTRSDAGAGGVAPGARGAASDASSKRTAVDADGSDQDAHAAPPEAEAADAGCYRHPYLPDKFEPPCEQPPGVPNFTDGRCTIEPGCFIMGGRWCQRARARHSSNPTQVTLTHRLRVQQFEATQRPWTDERLPTPSRFTADSRVDCLEPDCPVGNVSVTEVFAFANLLSRRQGLAECYVLEGCQGEFGAGVLCAAARSVDVSTYERPGDRLPTGAEGEYAARAGTKTRVWRGDVVERGPMFTCYDDPVLLPIAWYCANAGPFTHPVGQKMANSRGLCDVLGNAVEWVASATRAYGEGPYVDWGSEDLAQRITRRDLLQTRGHSSRKAPSTLQVGAKGGCPGRATAPGLGFRLVQTLN